MREYWQLCGIVVTLLLAGLGMLLPNSETYAVGLISLAGLIIVALLVHGYWYHRRVCLILDPLQSVKEGERIYEEAARKGGEVFATHILQRERDPGRDIAAKALVKANRDVAIFFERILICDHRDAERQ